MSKGGFCIGGRFSGLRSIDGPAGRGGGGMNDVAVGPVTDDAVGVPTRSSLLMASTFDLRCERCSSPSSTCGWKRGSGATSGYDLTVVNVGLDLRGSLGPTDDLGFAVDVDPFEDRGVVGFTERLALEGGLDGDSAGIVSLTVIEMGGSSGSGIIVDVA